MFLLLILIPREIADLTALGHFHDFHLSQKTDFKYAYAESYRINPLDLGRYSRAVTSTGSYISRRLNPRFAEQDLEKVFFSIDGGQTEIAEFAIGSHYNTESNTRNDEFYFQGSHWHDANASGIMNGAFTTATSFDAFSSDDLIALMPLALMLITGATVLVL